MENFYFLSCELKNIDNSIIRLACSLHLKVLFIMAKNSEQKFNLDQISSILKKSKEDIEDAIEFWSNFGIIKLEKNDSEVERKEEANLERANINFISKRMKSNDNINILLDKIETILGRPLSGLDISVFIKLKDFEGLTFNVILILVQYCVKIGKKSTSYIEKIGSSWAKEGINSVESAKEKIKITNKIISFWKKFSKIAGISNRIPTSKEKEIISKWILEWNYDLDVIKEAYERCVNSIGEYKISYMDGIIKRWKNDNVKSKIDIKCDNKCFDYVPTYDISKYEQLNKFGS